MSESAIERTKKRLFEEGLEAAIGRKAPDISSKPVKIDGAFEARLIALAQSDPPEGRSRWTVRLLAHKAVEQDLIGSIFAISVQRILKKRISTSPKEVLEGQFTTEDARVRLRRLYQTNNM